MTEADNQQDLLAKVANGDKQAFSEFYSSNVAVVRSFLFRRGLNEVAICDDLIQESFMRVWTKAGFYKEYKGSPRSWLLAIAQNCLYDYWRRIRRVPQMLDIETAPSSDEPSLKVEENELRDDWIVIKKAIGRELKVP